jgi:hypothetical protein
VLTPVILATQEAEIGGPRFIGRLAKEFVKLSGKKPIIKKGLLRVAQGVGPEFKP